MVNRCSATPAASTEPVKVRCGLVWTRRCGIRRLTGLAAAALLAAMLSGCGSGDSTVAKTPQPTRPIRPAHPAHPAPGAGAAPTSSAAADPCAVNLAEPAIARGVRAAPRPPQPAAVEPRAVGRQLQRMRAAVSGHRQSQYQRREPQHQSGDVSSRQADTAAGRARHLRIQRDRHLAVHRRHRGVELLRRYRLAKRGEVPLERQRGGADRQRRG